MRLEAFTVGYSLKEDRLLLQAVGDGATQSYWITRRAALMIGTGIQNLLTTHYQKFCSSRVQPEFVGDLMAFDQTVAAQKNPVKSGQIDASNPSDTFLVHQISYAAESAEVCVIQLTDAQGRGHGYRLAADMLHSLVNLLQAQCDQAGWALTLTRPSVMMSSQSDNFAMH